jgi:TonB family protein
MAPPPVAARAEETKDERPTPEVATKEPAQPEEIAEAAGQNSPAASRALVTAPATTFANTPRQYFAPSSDLFAQARNWATPSSAKASAAGGASAPHSDSDEARAAVPGEATLSQYEQNEQRAELSAERLDAYHAMRGQAKAVPASVSIQNQGTPQPQDIKVSGLVRQESLSQNRSPQDEASAMEYAFGTGGAAVLSSELPFPVPQSSKTLTEAAPVGEGLGDAAPGQEEPVQPWSGQDTAAPLPHAGMAESIPPRFDTMESLTQRILAALSAQKEYPPAALRRKTEGTVKLSLDVAPNGSLVMVKVQARSGSAILDEAALKLVRGIFPLDVRLASVVSLMVPVEYRIPK